MLGPHPFVPRTRLYVREALDAFHRPGEFLLLSQAVDILGQLLFRNSWTGAELTAREYPGRLAGPLPDESQDLALQFGLTTKQRWFVSTSDGRILKDTFEDADAIWEREKPKLKKVLAVERAEGRRLEKVIQKLVQALFRGALSSWAVSPDWQVFQIDQSEWAKTACRSSFYRLGDASTGVGPNQIWSNCVGGIPKNASIMVLEAELRSWITRAASETDEAITGRTIGEERADVPADEEIVQFFKSQHSATMTSPTQEDDVKAAREKWPRAGLTRVKLRLLRQMAVEEIDPHANKRGPRRRRS